MSIIEVTKVIEDPASSESVSLTLQRNTETGYFLLRPLVPLLSHYEGKRVNVDQSDEVRKEEEDRLCAKYGILVDTDKDGEKWITSDKVFQLLDMLNLLDLFKDDFDALNVTGEQERNNMKRVNGLEEFGMSLDSHRGELGSPLKKLKMDNDNSNKNNNSNTKPQQNKLQQRQEEINDRPIITFDHDLRDSTITNLPLKMNHALQLSSEIDNDERLKLENFLQRLLLPNIQNNSDSSNAYDNGSVSFNSLMHEMDATFPHTSLNLNIPIDEYGNTPLHWLTSTANIDLVKEMVKNGANRLLGDNSGESALVKATKTVNNYDSGTFEELLDYLYPCLILLDAMDRTILHHIVITSGMKDHALVAKYYLDILMGWIVKKQPRPIHGVGNGPVIDSLDLKWILTNMLNAQDVNGDTCLNIAARLGNVGIVDALLEYGADPYIANKSGLRPLDFGAGTSKFQTHELELNLDHDGANKHHGGDDDAILDHPTSSDLLEDGIVSSPKNKPDTKALVSELQTLLDAVSKDYDIEMSTNKEKLA